MLGNVNLVLGVDPLNHFLEWLGDLVGFVILKTTMMSLITLVSVNKPSGIPDGVQRSDFATLGGLLATRRRTCAVCREADARKTTTLNVVTGVFRLFDLQLL